jgi:hypothetical protein
MVSDANQQIARAAANAFGGEFRVHGYYDSTRSVELDILSCNDRPQRGLTSCATVGLSEHPIYRDGKDIGVRAELVGACDSGFGEFANVVASCAFEIICEQRFVAPGIIFPGVFGQYMTNSPMQHVLFVPPFLWPELRTIRLHQREAAWLLIVPVSDAEMKYAIEVGPAELEARFDEHQIDIYNPRRPSVL